jgi:hypothetical protein
MSNVLELLKQQLDGTFVLANFYRESIPETMSRRLDFISNLINATDALVKLHWDSLGKAFTPKFEFELVDKSDEGYHVEVKLSNGLVVCSKTLVLTVDGECKIVGMETNFIY